MSLCPSIDYQKKIVSVGREVLSEDGARKTVIEVTKLSVKKFKILCRKKKPEIEVSKWLRIYQLNTVSSRGLLIARIIECRIFLISFTMFSKNLYSNN